MWGRVLGRALLGASGSGSLMQLKPDEGLEQLGVGQVSLSLFLLTQDLFMGLSAKFGFSHSSTASGQSDIYPDGQSFQE